MNQPLTENTGRELMREIKRLNNLLGNPAKKKWVKVTTIREMTGWDHERMRRARNNGDVVFKKDKTGFWYDPTSLNPVFIKNNLKAA